MKKINRLLITILVALIFTILPEQFAVASEIAEEVKTTTLEVAQQTQALIEEVTTTEEASNTEASITLENENAAVVATNTEEKTDPSEDLQTEDGLDNIALEDFDVFVDEQGQVFYVEKEPEPVEIKEQPDEEVEETKSDSTKAKKESKKEKETKAKPSYSEKDLRLLSSLIYAEAGNQSYNGMLAVANVVLNRVHSDVYYHANTIKEVIYDKKWSVQFAVTVKSKKTGLSMLDKALKAYDTGDFSGRNPEAEKKAMNKAIKAAKAALEGENNIGNYLCFNAVNSSTKRIKSKYPDYKIIGDHIFYRTK